jgi:NAD+ synthase (glutamine-hydrolysing)
MSVYLCQKRSRLGDIAANMQTIRDVLKGVRADVVVFPELFVWGYPITDQFMEAMCQKRVMAAYDDLIHMSRYAAGLLVAGIPYYDGRRWYNGAVAAANGALVYRYAKHCLPNDDVFNESRYFSPGQTPPYFDWQGRRLGVLICEDIWAYTVGHYAEDPVLDLRNRPLDGVIHIAASPFTIDKYGERLRHLQRVTEIAACPVVSVNHVGGFTDLLFDGRSVVMTASGAVKGAMPAFQEATAFADDLNTPSPLSVWDTVWEALQFGLREYCRQAGFSRVILGLSGGIDSALVAAIAVAALGPEQVTTVIMPTEYNSPETMADAKDMAQRMGCHVRVIPIDTLKDAVATALDWSPTGSTIAHQNTQARLRGLLLMALANHESALLLTTGNKSELAQGYATLYGDMCGGLNLIGDLFKTDVYALVDWLGQRYNWIPDRIITRPPSAELAPHQRDTDTLPEYAVLDGILKAFLMKNTSEEDVARDYGKIVVDAVIQRYRQSEFKRYQAAPIIKLTASAFGRGRQFSITV